MLRSLRLSSTCGGKEIQTPVDSKDSILTRHLQYNRRILCGLLSAQVDRYHRPRRELWLSGDGAGSGIHCWRSDNAVLGKEMATGLSGTGDSRELSVLRCERFVSCARFGGSLSLEKSRRHARSIVLSSLVCFIATVYVPQH